MKHKIALILVSLLLISGCMTSIDDLIQQIPAVEDFLEEHPNAKITSVLWRESAVKENMDKIKSICNIELEIKPYYYTVVDEGNDKITLFIDKATQEVECLSIERGERLPEERPVKIEYLTQDKAEISKGLEEGELIISELHQEFKDKDKVEITEIQETLF